MQLPWPVDPAVRSMPRMLLEAVVQAPFGPLRVMTTHLEYYSQTQRAAQLEAVRARHAEACAHALDDRARSDSGDPFQAQPQTLSAILTGDFNLRADDPLHARMTAPYADGRVPRPGTTPGSTSIPARRSRRRSASTTATSGPTPFACDFIFATRDLRARLRSVAVDAATAASDHQPVLVELG